MESKFYEAIGLFWGASLFIGGLISVLLGFLTSLGWVFAGVTGGLSFLIIGLLSHGILSMTKRR